LVALLGLVIPGSIFGYPFSIDAPEPITVIYGFQNGQLVVLAALALLSLSFVCSAIVAARLPARLIPPALVGVLPLILAFVLMYPPGSQDLFHNLADARTLWRYGEWPMVSPPAAHAGDPIADAVTAWRDTNTTYGPLAYVVYALPSRLAGDGLVANLIAFKAFNAALLLLVAALASIAANSLTPGRETQAFVLVAWNPLLLFEAVANGHNDTLMAVLALTSLLITVRSRDLLGLFAVAGSATVKYATAAVAPITWAWLWLNATQRGRVVLLSLGLLGAVAFIGLYAVFGERLLTSPGPARGQGVVASPISLLAYALEPWLGLEAVAVARQACFLAFGVVIMVVLSRLKADPRSLFAAWFWVLLALPKDGSTYRDEGYLVWSLTVGAALIGSVEAEALVRRQAPRTGPRGHCGPHGR